MNTSYGTLLLFFIPIGLYYLFSSKRISKNLTISLVSMIIALYLFFSILVKTKMPAFTFPVSSLVWIIISTGLICKSSNKSGPLSEILKVIHNY